MARDEEDNEGVMKGEDNDSKKRRKNVAMLVFGRFVELPILVVLPCSDVFIKADKVSTGVIVATKDLGRSWCCCRYWHCLLTASRYKNSYRNSAVCSNETDSPSRIAVH